MGSVTIAHVIGTATLIMILGSVTMFYGIAYFSLRDQTLAQQLQEVADYVSSTFIDLVNLAYISSSNQFLYKVLGLPSAIGTSSYNVTLAEETHQVTQESMLIVKTFFSLNPYAFKGSLLPWTNVKIWTGGIIGSTEVLPMPFIAGGLTNGVAWVWKQEDDIMIGLGRIVD